MHHCCRAGIARWRAGFVGVAPHHLLEVACFATLSFSRDEAIVQIVMNLVVNAPDAMPTAVRNLPDTPPSAPSKDPTQDR
jgi:hypothetical protein